MSKFYSLNEIDKIKNVQYHIIYGERSNGKSFALNKRALDNFFKFGEEFIICKRYSEDMKTATCSTMLTPLYDYVLEEYDHKIKFYHGCWWAYHKDSDGKMVDCKPMGYALSVSATDRGKGSQYPNVTTIIFEEFMSQSAIYLNDEVNLFINLVSTVVRNRTNVKIYLLGNAISKYSPYATALDIKLHRLNKGEIVVKEYKDNKGRRTKFAIQRTENVDVFDTKENTEGIVYNVFGNSGVGKMITTGDFETHSYNKTICNVTFNENLKMLNKGHYRLVNNKDRINILIRYEDYIYSIYRICHNNEIVYAFREISEKNVKCNKYQYFINNKKHYNGIINIINLNSYTDKYIDIILDEMLHAYKQDKFIFMNDDNGEDVNSAFNMVTK